MKTTYLVEELTEKTNRADTERLTECLMAVDGVVAVIVYPATGEVSVTCSPTGRPQRSAIRGALRSEGFTLQSSKDWL